MAVTPRETSNATATFIDTRYVDAITLVSLSTTATARTSIRENDTNGTLLAQLSVPPGGTAHITFPKGLMAESGTVFTNTVNATDPNVNVAAIARVLIYTH